MQKSKGAVVIGEVRHLLRALRNVGLYVYLPLTLLLIAVHFPYDTDATVARAAASTDERTATSFYEAAYRPSGNDVRGLDYEDTAARAAKAANVEGRVRAFVERFGLQDKRVLDIGSGRGYLQDMVADYTGLDLSSKVAPYYHKPFVVGSATEMPFPDDAFDAAWTVWVVEHLPEPEKAFREMRRVIKPGGVLFLMVAWHCTPWAAGGFEVRPYRDFNLAGKLVKASIPIRRTTTFWALHGIRAVRWGQYTVAGHRSLHFGALQPNYDVYWQPDSDATVSLDRFEALLWFQSRGDGCLNCASTAAEWISVAQEPLIIRIN